MTLENIVSDHLKQPRGGVMSLGENSNTPKYPYGKTQLTYLKYYEGCKSLQEVIQRSRKAYGVSLVPETGPTVENRPKRTESRYDGPSC